MKCIGKFVHKMEEKVEEGNFTWESLRGVIIGVEKLGKSSGKSKSQKRRHGGEMTKSTGGN